MSGTNETLADILAEMRDLGKLDEKCCDMIPRSLQGLGLRTYADRIAAAAERERDATPGNAAAMREALEELVANIEMRGATFGLNVMVDTKTFLDAKAALSTPPRNCDRYATWSDAWDAFAATYFGPTDPGEMEYLFGVWLFAKAEGGAE